MKNEYKNGRLSVINEMIRFHEKEMLAAQNAKGKNKDKDIHLSGVINANGKAIQNLKKKIRNIEDKQREMGNNGPSLTFEQCLLEEFLINTQNYPKEYHNLFNQKFNRAKKRFDEQSLLDVMPRSYGIVRWYDNTQKDVVCVDRATAEDYVDKYNKLAGEEKCYVDEDIWLPLNKA